MANLNENLNEVIIQSTPDSADRFRLYISGDQRLTNELICYYLESNTAFSCTTGTFEELADALKQGDKPRFKVILLDFNSPQIREKLEGDMREFVVQLGGLPAIVFNFNAKAHIKRWIAHGIRGLLYLGDPSQNMVKAIKAVAEGHMWLPQQAMSLCFNDLGLKKPINDGQTNRLTQREREVLTILASGKSNSEVAEKLFISPYTVKVHLQNIYKKIGVQNRVKAAIWARQNFDQSL